MLLDALIGTMLTAIEATCGRERADAFGYGRVLKRGDLEGGSVVMMRRDRAFVAGPVQA